MRATLRPEPGETPLDSKDEEQLERWIAGRRMTAAAIVVFDCDATLSSIEGIDWLADRKGVAGEVATLTSAAVSGSVALEDVFAERLRLVEPTRKDLAALAEAYAENIVEDATAVIAALQACGRSVRVVSGGLADAVVPFATDLGIAADHVYAVPVRWDAADRWEETAAHPLARAGGKPRLLEGLGMSTPIILIGDGATDAEARAQVQCLIGYGGVKAQPSIREAADAWIGCRSLAPVVPWVLGSAGRAELETGPHLDVWERGRARIEAGDAVGGCPGLEAGRSSADGGSRR